MSPVLSAVIKVVASVPELRPQEDSLDLRLIKRSAYGGSRDKAQLAGLVAVPNPR